MRPRSVAASAEHFTAMLLHHTGAYALDQWNAYGRVFQGEILVRRGELEKGLPLLRNAVGELGGARFDQYRTALLGALARGEAAAGETAAAMAAIDEALAWSERTGEGWRVAELRRTKGELLLL